MKKVSILLICWLFSITIFAQSKITPSPIIFIYDASGSMWGKMDGKTKMAIASEVLSSVVNKLPDNQKIGFVAYGHRKEGDCKDVEFLVQTENGKKSEVISSLNNINPLGKTPLAYSALLVIDKLRQSKLKATIILITDGIESCGGNICDVIQGAKKEGIDFKLHIIGFGLKAAETEQLKCAAKAGDGNYYDATGAVGLSEVLDEATSQSVDKPKGNVSVFAFKNGIPIDAWVKAYDVLAKREPISVRTYQDTAYFYLPPSKYNFEVTPLEGSDVKKVTVAGIQSFEDKIVHQNVSFDGGKIKLVTTNNGENWDCIVKIIDQEGKVAASLRMYQEPKEVEVNPGTYKISIQALVELKGMETYAELDKVVVNSAEITPVSYAFYSGKFALNVKADGKLIDSVVNINDLISGTNVAAGRTYNREKEFLLTPGKYKVKVAPLGDFKDRKPQEFTIEILKGQRVDKELIF